MVEISPGVTVIRESVIVWFARVRIRLQPDFDAAKLRKESKRFVGDKNRHPTLH